VCWGAVETDEFKRQSCDFAHMLNAASTRCESFEVPQRNHFDVILDLTDASTHLGAATLSLLNAS
jgi:arylformamidase